MRESTDARTFLGLTLAAIAGIAALVALAWFPRARRMTLLALGVAWLLINMTVMTPRLPGADALGLRALYRRVHEQGYRTSLSSKVLALAGMAILTYAFIIDR